MGTQQYPSASDGDIAAIMHHLSLLPRSHPERPLVLTHLANARLIRHESSGQEEDLAKHLLHATEAIFLPSGFRAGRIVQVFYAIACALLFRSEETDKPDDVNYAIQYFRYLRDSGIPLEACNVSRIQTAEKLVTAISTQVELEAGSDTRITEIIQLCYDLLSSDVSGGHTIYAFVGLGRAIHAEFFRDLQMKILDEAIECFRAGVKAYPPWLDRVHEIHEDLATALYLRYIKAPADDDYQEATIILNEIVVPQIPRDSPSPHSATASVIMARFIAFRCMRTRSIEHIEEAISRCHIMLAFPFLGETERSAFAELLKWCAGRRSEFFGLGGAQHWDHSGGITIPIVKKFKRRRNWHSHSHAAVPVRPTQVFVHSHAPPEDSLAEIRNPLGSLTPAQIAENSKRALDRASFSMLKASTTGKIEDIEEAIKYQRMVLASSQAPNSRFQFAYSRNLGDLSRMAFDLSGRTEYLEESISADRHAVGTAAARPDHFGVYKHLCMSLIDRWRLLHREQDLDESMHLCGVVTDDQYVNVADRLDLACLWASNAREAGHPSVLTAYQRAMSLVQSFLVSAPTLDIQHAHLVSKDKASEVPLEYASYLIHTGQLEQAIETLEQGRALLWSEMRGLRTSIDQLRANSPGLADQLAEFNRELETLTTSILLRETGAIAQAERGAVEDEGADTFGLIFRKHRTALEERGRLISQIRELPGFEDFQRTPKFDALCKAASRGPVIIINHCKWRSDILILLRDSPPSLIPTADDFYDRATKLKDDLLETRNKYSPGSPEYEDVLRSTLVDLYTLVGRPVVDRLRELNIPENSRVWWCPTSVFCALPLHAMGPIPSDEQEQKKYFLDIFIPSYTPTLSALIQSRAPGKPTSDRPSLLLVGRPNDNLPGVWREIEAIEAHLGESVHRLVSDDATSDAVKEGLQRHPFLHLACHGNLETGRPFDAWFKLRGDGRLTLLDIVRSRLPNAEFAFLSACHSAELTDKSIADEALHLAAAMQYSGYRSVVGTLWAVVDDDGPEMAKQFYKTMSPNDGKKMPPHRRSARSLRIAIQKLRKQRSVTLERWVNFVHYGA